MSIGSGSQTLSTKIPPPPPSAARILTGVKLVRRLEVNDEGQPGVVQEVPGGVALGQDANNDARNQSTRAQLRDRQQGLRYWVIQAGLIFPRRGRRSERKAGGGGRGKGGGICGRHLKAEWKQSTMERSVGEECRH